MENASARELLLLSAELPTGAVRLLFLGGVAASALPDGGAAWADTEGDRVILFDGRGRVADVLQGADSSGRLLTGPISVAADARGVMAAEPGGSALLFTGGRPDRWLEPGLPGPLGGSSRAGSAVARTYLEFALAPVRPTDPLVWHVPPDGGAARAIGKVQVPENGLLGQLVNAGWAATGPDGEVYFASAIQPEVRRFGPAGDLEWVSRWRTPEPVEEPRFVADGRSLRPEFAVLQHGIALGIDGLAYVLATPEAGSDTRLLIAVDDAGELARSARVVAGTAIFGDSEGRVYAIPMAYALSRTPSSTRPAFRPFDLPALDRSGKVALEEYRGRVLVLNFWASWCAPCRKEMPLLNAFAAELDPGRAVVLGLNEDLRPADGLAFIEEIGGIAYRNAAGEGRLRDRYHYRGLPYTLILDRELRVAKSFYGFGRTIDPIRAAVLAELEAVDAGG